MAADDNAQKGKTGAASTAGGAAGATGQPTGGQQISGQQIFTTTEQNAPGGESFATTERGAATGGGVSGGATGGQSSAAGATGGQPPQGDLGNQTADQLSSQVGEVLRGNTTGVTGAAKDLLSQAKEQTGNVASKAIGQVTDKASAALDEHKGTLAQGLTSVADNLRQMTGNLRGGEQQGGVVDFTARYGDTLATQVENVAGYLEGRDLRQLVGDLERFARRNPAVFVGSAFALGLFAARFLKSSPRQELMIRPQQATPIESAARERRNMDEGVHPV